MSMNNGAPWNGHSKMQIKDGPGMAPDAPISGRRGIWKKASKNGLKIDLEPGYFRHTDGSIRKIPGGVR